MDFKRCSESISSKRNNPEIEREFRETCSSYESQFCASNSPFSQNYQTYIDLYHRKTSLYLMRSNNKNTSLVIYDTETEKEEEIILNTPRPLDIGACIVLLPNGNLFFLSKDYFCLSSVTLIVDKNYQVRVLPSGMPCGHSSGTYFNDNVYCFGGLAYAHYLTLCRKFDLKENRWIDLTPMPQADSSFQSVLFNANILISGFQNKNLLIYSVDVDSFSRIPYDFANNMCKILINVDRLYLIEYNGLVYESEDEYNWRQISKSRINSPHIQSYCSYNKGGIYIATLWHKDKYFKFDLKQKAMIKI